MKQSKQRSRLFMPLLLIITGLGLTSCSGEDLESNQSDDNSRFYVNVADAGYNSASNGIHTRSSEQGYNTEFTAGDQIGVFAVKNNQIIAEVKNLCLTATDNNGALVWKDTGGNAPLKFDGAVYYAYYPYESSLTGTLVPTATDADGFFSNVVSNWTPSTDQGVYTKYTAQDLMTAKGAISNNELSFAMQHEMALAVIELPGTKYKFSNTNPSLPDYVIDPQDSRFDSYKPCKMADGMYRYLVKPVSTNKLTGSYTNASNAAKGWEVNPAGISSGSYKTFKVDGGIANVISGYNLQVGDYMLKDGSLVSKDVALTPTQQSNCIGRVFWIDPAAWDHYSSGTPTGYFGKIVSQESPSGNSWGPENVTTGATSETDGLMNMAVITAITNWKTNYPVFAWVDSKNIIGTTYSSGLTGIWYLPAKDELEVLRNSNLVSFPNYRWSSTENTLNTTQAWSRDLIGADPHDKGRGYKAYAIRNF
ncbi:fimbrillin family protein [Dysgonomonas capnocytophagoides]|uniref:fimbrillin family protein n=1 Tax=Dysgonomonas capnocytophagoides TaxID=45254 RepID=UPI00333FE3BB